MMLMHDDLERHPLCKPKNNRMLRAPFKYLMLRGQAASPFRWVKNDALDDGTLTAIPSSHRDSLFSKSLQADRLPAALTFTSEQGTLLEETFLFGQFNMQANTNLWLIFCCSLLLLSRTGHTIAVFAIDHASRICSAPDQLID